MIFPAGRRHLVRQGDRLPRPAVVPGAGGHWTRTLVISFPVASSTWTPQAMQGSKEWMVRRISSGCSGFTSGWLSTSAASYGPHLPLRVPGRAVPGARDHALIAGDLAVLDLDPVAQRAARRVEVAVPLRLGRPLVGLHLSPLKVWVSPLLIRSTRRSYQTFIRRARRTVSIASRRDAAQGGEECRRIRPRAGPAPPSPSPGSPRGRRRSPPAPAPAARPPSGLPS